MLLRSRETYRSRSSFLVDRRCVGPITSHCYDHFVACQVQRRDVKRELLSDSCHERLRHDSRRTWTTQVLWVSSAEREYAVDNMQVGWRNRTTLDLRKKTDVRMSVDVLGELGVLGRENGKVARH
jgi:hypothetical protein